MTGFRWIVNPGDFLDVVECAGRFEAMRYHESAKGSRLYRCSSQIYMSGRRYTWEEYQSGSWMPINRDNLPIKVLEAGEK